MTDIEFHCLERGQGRPLILLHGNGEDHTYFDSQIEHFAKRFHVYALDSRGHGQTPRGTKPLTIRQMAADLAVFMDDRRLARATVLGFSDGANIAMEFAVNNPARVEALILNSGNLDPSGLRASVRAQIILKACVYRLAFFTKTASRRLELLRLMLKEPDLAPADLARIDCPTLVLVGTRDMITLAHSRLIAAGLPQTTLKVIDGDHFVAKRNPDRFNRAVDEWMASSCLSRNT